MVIKAVIGANYGDEGKGLMTDYLCCEALKAGSCLNVLTNGGAQRGHTVVTPDGKRHVFHHFGSGTFAGADTYIPEQFVVNPMAFMEEYKELDIVPPSVFIDSLALMTTPYDMIYNTFKMKQDGLHNSCGYGVYHTKMRHYHMIGNSTIQGFINANTTEERVKRLEDIRSYYANRMEKEKIELTEKWKEIFYSDKLIYNFIYDFESMMDVSSVYPFDAYQFFEEKYDTIIFENAQGLLLDKDRDPKFGTSSNTGLKAVYDMLGHKHSVEPVYVSRTYLTRHGDGELPGECEMKFADLTNVHNEFQGDLRYAPIDFESLYERIEKDSASLGLGLRPKVALTHCDESSPFEKQKDNGLNFRILCYASLGPTRNDVVEVK